jgi:crotonobetainyl-CoA:carnitine CoA-transferase CaiB-like acyl-CoA transferase
MDGRPLAGVRVVELAAWTFVPAAGAVLAEWGADVIKVEHPDGGDPQRGLIATGMIPGGASGINYMIEQPNHGKRSIGLDVRHDRGHDLLLQLCAGADVFVTNWLPGARGRASVDVEDIRAANPDIIYVRGSGQGPRGPDRDRGGYDGSSFWARSGIVDALTMPGDPYGPTQPPAIGDLAGGQTIAGGIAAALYRRATTGETSVVDVSLLGLGMWMLSPGIVAQKLYGATPRFARTEAPNPIANRYLTADGRVVHLVMLQSGRFWPSLVRAVGLPALADDPRFATPEALHENRVEAIRILDAAFAARTLAEWREALASVDGVWAAAQRAVELHDDPQAIANGYLSPVTAPDGERFPLVANPVQFDEQPAALTRAPEAGEHTDAILGELGLDWERIVELKLSGAVQ